MHQEHAPADPSVAAEKRNKQNGELYQPTTNAIDKDVSPASFLEVGGRLSICFGDFDFNGELPGEDSGAHTSYMIIFSGPAEI